jgi:hypothetical protein
LLPAGCGAIHIYNVSLLVGCGAIHIYDFFLDQTGIERKKQAFSLQKPYFQPYFLNKTTLVANKEPPPPQTLLALLIFNPKTGE